MNNPEILINMMSEIQYMLSIKKEVKEFIRDKFEKMKEHVTEEESAIVAHIINVMCVTSHANTADKERIRHNLPQLITIATKYKDTYNCNSASTNNDVVVNMIYPSQSLAGRLFKKDVLNILANLRKRIGLRMLNPKASPGMYAGIDPDKCVERGMEKERAYKYDSNFDKIYLEGLIMSGEIRSQQNYYNKCVSYAMLMFIENRDREIVMKFGHTRNLEKRMETLRVEYECDVMFIGAKIIDERKREASFHAEIKEKFPELIFNYSVNGQKKDGLYKLNPILMRVHSHSVKSGTDDTNRTNRTGRTNRT